jgi:hypothetical protein
MSVRRAWTACAFLAPGAGGAGFLPQKVLRTFWGPRKGSPAGAGAGEGRA